MKNRRTEWLYGAGVHIFIAAKSDSQNFGEETIKALKDARAAKVEIHVALYHPKGTQLPPVWQEIQVLATTFDAEAPYAKFVRCREMVVADDYVYTETKDNMGNWVGHSEEKMPAFTTALSTFFNVDTKALEHDVADYNRLFRENLQNFERCLEARMRCMDPGTFPHPARFSYRLNKKYEEDVQQEIKAKEKYEKSLLGRAINIITIPFQPLLALYSVAIMSDIYTQVQARRKRVAQKIGIPPHDLKKYPVGRGDRTA